MTNVNFLEQTKSASMPNEGVERERKMLQEHRLFNGLCQSSLDYLLQERQYIQLADNQALFHEGDQATSYYLVLKGAIVMHRYSREGEERVFTLFSPKQLVAHFAMFMLHGLYPMNARSQNETTVLQLQRHALHQACEHDGVLATRLLHNLSERMYQQVNQLDWLSSSNAAQRLAHYLLQLQTSSGDAIYLPINQRLLAAHLGIRAETLSRLLSDWQKQGHIQGRRQEWIIHNQTFLQDLAQGAKRRF